MQIFTKKVIILSQISLLALWLNGCTSQQVVGVSDMHLYNDNYGIIANPEADAMVEHEILAQNEPTEIDTSLLIDDPTLTTELRHDPEAVTAENYVEVAPVITYKYMDSPTFYTEEQLPKNKLMRPSAISSDRY